MTKKKLFLFWEEENGSSRSEPLRSRSGISARLLLRNSSAHRLSSSEPSRWQH
jgi:hypothetical protein